MVTLTIYNGSSVYWTEYFNDVASCNAWIDEEQTRPYWNPSYTWVIVDNTPTPEEIADQEAAIAAAKADREAKRASGAAKLKTTAGLTDEEVAALFG